MHLIDSPGATLDNRFTDGDPATATEATVVWAKFMNTLMDELVEVVEQAGITLDDNDNTQLYQAIMILIAAAVPSVPDATTTDKGKVELATNTEASTGTDTERAVTPAGVKAAIDARVASASAAGIVELATDGETQAGTDATRAVTPAGLASMATSTVLAGLIELATSSEAITGTDAVRAITPATLLAVLNQFDPEPIGVVKAWAGTAATVPSKYLLCYGQAVSRTTYATLFARTGTAYGAGDGSSTFNLPDLRGRTIAGLDNMGGTAANRVTTALSGISGVTLGAVGGVQASSITIAQMPSHTHEIEGSPSDGGFGDAVGSDGPYTGTPVFNTRATGGGQPFPIMQPTLMANYIIKAL